MNQTAKLNALSPTGKNPAENTPLDEIRTSVFLSTDRNEPPLSVSSVVDEKQSVWMRQTARKTDDVVVFILSCEIRCRRCVDLYRCEGVVC